MLVHMCNLWISGRLVRTNLFTYTQPTLYTLRICIDTYVSTHVQLTDSRKIYRHESVQLYSTTAIHMKCIHLYILFVNICNLQIPGRSIGTNLFSYTQPQLYTLRIHIDTYVSTHMQITDFKRICQHESVQLYSTTAIHIMHIHWYILLVHICNLRIPGRSIGTNLFSYTQPQGCYSLKVLPVNNNRHCSIFFLYYAWLSVPLSVENKIKNCYSSLSYAIIWRSSQWTMIGTVFWNCVLYFKVSTSLLGWQIKSKKMGKYTRYEAFCGSVLSKITKMIKLYFVQEYRVAKTHRML